MALKDDLAKLVKATFASTWDEEDATEVPEPKDIRLDSNHSKKLDGATVLYADLDASTAMVDGHKWWFSAEIYKTYLTCASRIIRDGGGTPAAYDGDRVMGIWKANHRTSAVRTAMKINYAVREIINPALAARYPAAAYRVSHRVGVDTSVLHAVRIGVRGDNDITWVGRASNYAAKLCALGDAPLWITGAVYDAMDDAAKFGGNPKRDMWDKRTWTSMNDMTVYCSTWQWSID